MTDPKDAPKKWPEGLKQFLESLGVKSLTEALKKKVKPSDKKIRKYWDDDKDIDWSKEPE